MQKKNIKNEKGGILAFNGNYKDSPFVKHGFNTIRARKQTKKRTKKSKKNMNYSKQKGTGQQIDLL